MKKLFIIFAAAIITLSGCAGNRADNNPETSAAKAGKLTIAASFYPLAEFAKQVAGPDAEIITVTPPGAEPHDFEPTPRDITKVYSAILFVYNGAGVDAWAEKLDQNLQQAGIKTLRMDQTVGIYVFSESNGSMDPHFWLDPVIAQKEVTAIAETMVRLDPANAGTYQANAKNYINQLAALDAEYQKGLSDCAKKEIFTSHEAFAYLAKRYGFAQIPIAGLSPENEPSPGRLAELSTQAKKNNIRYIFFETLVSPKLAQTVADEIGAQTLVLNPIESLTGEETAAGRNYISEMESNLANLKTALECK